ncbi:MAG: gamma carbonic anhydrase family protein [Alphaproteobacteria bacterium CG11_big_fil_rev_8_21_14_0_20_44_7]|nr:MAG: gamma carbonic anhydrase family protein [Alphaproteobacteria bacterium CG11_big_fil_rev_8_21_14_0_20_44_7]
MKSIILPYKGILPKIADDAFIAPSAAVIGDVKIGNKVGVWFNVTIRGDVAPITIGAGTNIQDNSCIHVTRGGHPTNIGAGVTIGHSALIHAATIEDNSFIGMGAIIMDDAVVESNAMLAAGAMLTPGKRIPSGQLWAGSPAKYFRDLTQEELNFIPISAANYMKHVEEYLQELN